MVDKHGLKMVGLSKLSGETKQLTRLNSSEYYQVNYNVETGEVWGDYLCSLGQNSWEKYHDGNIINCGNVSKPTSMQDIADMVSLACAYNKFYAKQEVLS